MVLHANVWSCLSCLPQQGWYVQDPCDRSYLSQDVSSEGAGVGGLCPPSSRVILYGYNDKVGMFSIIRECLAKRSDVCTGTLVGETIVLEDVSVAAEYRQQYFSVNARKLWWFHADAR